MPATVVLIEDLYQGTKESDSIPWPAGMSTCTGTALMSNADIADPTKRIDVLSLHVSFNGGLSFQQAVSTMWTCGTKDKNGTFVPPSLNVSYNPAFPPTHVKLHYELPAAMSIGGMVEFAA